MDPVGASRPDDEGEDSGDGKVSGANSASTNRSSAPNEYDQVHFKLLCWPETRRVMRVTKVEAPGRTKSWGEF